MTTTTQYPSGHYAFTNLAAGTYDIQVSKTLADLTQIQGARSVALAADQKVLDADLVTADPAQAGTVTGKIEDNMGTAIQGATVAVADSVLPGVTTGADGGFTLTGVPAGDRTIQATKPGFDRSVVAVNVTAAGSSDAGTVRLATQATPMVPPPDRFQVLAITSPQQAPTRAAVSVQAAIRAWLLRAKGFPVGLASISRQAQIPASPQVDLMWAYDAGVPANAAGYRAFRDPSAVGTFGQLAGQTSDPSARALVDASSAVAVGTAVHYKLAAFSRDASGNATEGARTNVQSATPLAAISATAPASGTTVDPAAGIRFRWDDVAGAGHYYLTLWDTFDLGNPVWRSPDVAPGGRQADYDGIALASGKTYYWAVIAGDGATLVTDTSASFSSVSKFTVQ